MMTALLTRWLVPLLVTVLCGATHAAQTPASIRVVLDDNYPPYSFRDSNGQPQGILKDLWDLWQQRSGIRVDYQPMDWGKARATLESGQADVIDTIFETEARKKIYDFSKPYATIEVPLFFHQSVSGIKDAASAKGFTVGVKDGDACIDHLAANGITEFKRYPSYEAQVKAAIEQEVRVLCIDMPAALYFFNRQNAAGQFRHTAPLYVGQFHWAVAKGRSDLKQRVEAGFALISSEERAAIERRWLGSELATDIWSWLGRYGAFALLLIVTAIICLFVWNWDLRRRVSARTVELELADSASRESEARYRALVDLSSDWYWEQDEDLRFTSLSKPEAGPKVIDHARFVGLTRRELSEIVWDDVELRQLEAITQARQPFREFEIGRIYGNGQKQYIRLSGIPMFDPSGAFRGYRGVGCDITERKRSEEQLHLAANVFAHAREGILVTNAQGCIIEVNEAFSRISGFSRSEVLGHTPRIPKSFAHDGDFFKTMWSELLQVGYWSGEILNRRKNGEEYPAQVTISAVRDEHGTIGRLVALFSDISERKRMEEQVHQLAFYDPLTRLPNRRLLNDRLSQAMVGSKRSGVHSALMTLDLDNFKPLNDQHGHRAGDLLLVEVAHRLANCIRESDSVARVGGDEFAVLLCGLSSDAADSLEDAKIIAEKIRTRLAEVYRLPLRDDGASERLIEHQCSASIGFTLFLGLEPDADNLLDTADALMYEAKTAGRNSIRYRPAAAGAPAS